MSVRIGYLSVMQKKKLTELVMEDPQLISGKFSPTFTLKDAKNRWESIANTLNAIPGGCKDWKQWRKCWQDLKAKTKNKQANLVRYARGTGGGPSLDEGLTEDEARILETINPASIQGHVGVSESIATFDMGTDDTDAFTTLHNPNDFAGNTVDISRASIDHVGTVNSPIGGDQSDIEVEDDCILGQSTPNYLNKKRVGSIMAAKKIMKYSEENMKIKKEKLEIQKQQLAVAKKKNRLMRQTNLHLKKIVQLIENSKK